MRKALCVGINDYPGFDADLAGCINDANDWAAFLGRADYKTTLLLNDEASAVGVRDSLVELVESLGPGDHGVFIFAGHGTWVPDDNNDEKDGRDEAFVGADGELLMDDEVDSILRRLSVSAQLTVITDCCHSGTILRAFGEKKEKRRIRFLPPQLIRPEIESLRVEVPSRWRPKMQKAYLSRPNVVHLAACRDHEYAHDAAFRGRPNGAFTYYCLKELRAASASLTAQQLKTKISAHLPSWEYPQQPLFSAGTGRLLTRALFS